MEYVYSNYRMYLQDKIRKGVVGIIWREGLYIIVTMFSCLSLEHDIYIYIYIYTHTHIHIYIYTHTHTYIYIYTHRVSQEECAKLREGVPYVNP